MKRTARLCRPMTAAAVLMLAVAGMVPLSLVSPSAHGAEPVPAGGPEAASMAVTAPTSFGRSAEPIPDELPATTVNHAPDQNVLNYWTHERMAASKSLDSPAADDSTQERSVADGNNGDSSSSTDPAAMTEPVAPVADGVRHRPPGPRGSCSSTATPLTTPTAPPRFSVPRPRASSSRRPTASTTPRKGG